MTADNHKHTSAHFKRKKRGSRAYRRGQIAEFFCRLSLMLKGYRILASRYKTRQGELDIVAARGNVIAFIEVKARPTIERASEAVSPQQQIRLARAASIFAAHLRGYPSYAHRFDVMLVLPWRWPRHIPNAFTASIRK